MKNLLKTSVSDQSNGAGIASNNESLACAKDRVITLLWVSRSFQLVDQIQADQLLDGIQKYSQASDADDTVNLALLITDADDHAFFSDDTHFDGFRFKFLQNFSVQLAEFFRGNNSCFHDVLSMVINGVPRPDMITYARKYICKAIFINYMAEAI